ncbi:unnamed protein product [Malus baccata var. baccata]
MSLTRGTRAQGALGHVVGIHRKLQLNELEELRNDAYENARIYKEKTKAFHDKMIRGKTFTIGQKVLLFNSRLRFLDKVDKKMHFGAFWSKMELGMHVTYLEPSYEFLNRECNWLNCAIQLQSLKTQQEFKVNGHRLKPYYEAFEEQVVENVPLHVVGPVQA